MRKALLMIAIICSTFIANAQTPNLIWEKSYGGTRTDKAYSIAATNNAGYIIAGTTFSTDGDVSGFHGTSESDVWVVKINSSGIIEWQKTLGGSDVDEGYSVIQLNDGAYIVAGYTESIDGDLSANNQKDCWIIKLSSSGTILWQKTIGGSFSLGGSSYNSSRRTLINTSDGGFMLAGTTSSNGGDVTGNHGDDDFWVAKMDTSGTIQWQKSYGGSGFDVARSVIQTSDGGYILAGGSGSNDNDVTENKGLRDGWVVKIDNSGVIQWQKSLGGSDIDEFRSVIQTSDGSYIIAGVTESNDGDISLNNGSADYWIVKLSSSGNIVWQKTLGGSSREFANSIVSDINGGFVILGYNSNNYWAVKLDDNGTVEWQKFLGGGSSDIGECIIQNSDGSYILAGTAQSTGGDITMPKGNADYWVVKLSSGSTSIEDENQNKLLNIFPNPTTDKITLTLSEASSYNINIYNSIGQQVYNGTMNTQQQVIDLGNAAKGIYYVQLGNGEAMVSKRVVVE